MAVRDEERLAQISVLENARTAIGIRIQDAFREVFDAIIQVGTAEYTYELAGKSMLEEPYDLTELADSADSGRLRLDHGIIACIQEVKLQREIEHNIRLVREGLIPPDSEIPGAEPA